MRAALLLMLVWVNAHGQPRPLRNVSRAPSPSEISILRVSLQDLKPAHGGPSYFPVKRQPFRGMSEIAEATVFGQEAIATIRFELVDQAGRVIRNVPAMRTGNGADSDGYVLKLEVPDLPFRIQIRGTDLRGRPFSSTWKSLFVPMEGGPAAPVPPGAQFQSGDLRISRPTISDATYEPLVSPNGNPLGLRIAFTVRFSEPGYYDVTPHVFPVYVEYRWRGEVGMHSSTIGQTRFDADTEYHLTFDMIPSYVNRNREGGYCLLAPARLAVFEEIMASRQPLKYRIDISSLDFVSETEPMEPQRTWLEAFQREGATRCAQ
jgi:hypothetical protein